MAGTRQHTGIILKGVVDRFLDRQRQIVRHFDGEAYRHIRVIVAVGTFGITVEIEFLAVELRHRVIQLPVYRSARRNRVVTVEFDEPLRPVTGIGFLFNPAVRKQLLRIRILHTARSKTQYDQAVHIVVSLFGRLVHTRGNSDREGHRFAFEILGRRGVFAGKFRTHAVSIVLRQRNCREILHYGNAHAFLIRRTNTELVLGIRREHVALDDKPLSTHSSSNLFRG